MRIILVRHGDPDYEKDRLTEIGRKQAEIVAKRLLSEGITEVYTSPLGRAVETAEYFRDVSGLDVKTLDFMEEIRFGKKEALYESGSPWIVVDELMNEGYDISDPSWKELPQFKENVVVEDVEKICIKTDEWLSSLGYEREGLYYKNTNEENSQKTIAIFAHGGSGSAMFSRILNIPFLYLCATLHMPHTAISILRFDKIPGTLTTPVIELLSDATHLKD